MQALRCDASGHVVFRLACWMIGVAGLCSALLASASESPDGRPPSSHWGLGAGVSNQQKPYAGIERDTTAVPVIQFENRHIRWLGPLLEVKTPGLALSDSQRLDLSLVALYDVGGGYEEDDARILRGMDDRKSGLWAGTSAVWRTGLVDVSARWITDLSGYSDGQRVSVGLEKAWRLGARLRLAPRMGLVWHDDKFVDYYFGVRANEARADRPLYEGEAGIDTYLGVQALYRLGRQHTLLLDLSATRLAPEIEDSPLVDRSTENRVLLGYVYRF